MPHAPRRDKEDAAVRPPQPAPPSSHLAGPPAAPAVIPHRRFGHTLDDYSALSTGEQTADEPARPPDRSNLPPGLRAGIEALSGFSLDDVRVHYNSAHPAGLRALAYAQGSDIHLGPGQEQHLPHEAWHVVQQKQGRVAPTLQAQGRPVNDDAGLEAEADAMGRSALQAPPRPAVSTSCLAVADAANGRAAPIQGVFINGVWVDDPPQLAQAQPPPVFKPLSRPTDTDMTGLNWPQNVLPQSPSIPQPVTVQQPNINDPVQVPQVQPSADNLSNLLAPTLASAQTLQAQPSAPMAPPVMKPLLSPEARQREQDWDYLRKMFTTVDEDHDPSKHKPNEISAGELDVYADLFSSIREDKMSLKIDTGVEPMLKAEMMKDIAKILQTGSGRTLVGDLATGGMGKEVTIGTSQTSGDFDKLNAHQLSDNVFDAADPTRGTGSQVKYMPGAFGKLNKGLNVENGDAVNMPAASTADTTLFHELTHARHAAQGVFKPLANSPAGLTPEVVGDAHIEDAVLAGNSHALKDKNVNMEEWATVGLGPHAADEITENAYRREQRKIAPQPEDYEERRSYLA